MILKKEKPLLSKRMLLLEHPVWMLLKGVGDVEGIRSSGISGGFYL